MTAPEPIRDPHKYFGIALIFGIIVGVAGLALLGFAVIGTWAGWLTW